MSMRDKITEILLGYNIFVSEAEEAADEIIAILPDYEAQQARIDKLGSILTNIVRGDIHHEIFSEDITGAEVAALANTLRAALKGTDA